MRTNSEFVSRVVNDFKAVSKDGRISKRHVLHIGKSKAAFLISQKWDELTMFKEEGLVTHIDCFEFESVEVKRCDIFEFRLCRDLMKSTLPVPGIVYGKNGPAVLHATNVDGTKDYTYITPRDFNSIAKRKYVIRDDRYFYMKDGYVYLPNSTNELLDISVISLDKIGCKEASSCAEGETGSIWDSEFVCPDRFYDIVVRDTVQELASVWRTSVKDENPNMNSNEK